MPIHSPPYYRYSLFDSWDRKAFALIKRVAKTKNYPKVAGTKEEKNKFLLTLIRTQKSLHGWRRFLSDVLNQVKNTYIINTKVLLNKYPPGNIGKEKPALVTYEEDEIANDFIDKLATKKVNFIGPDKEIAEFVLRFILGQLGHDWEQIIMMIWEMLGNDDQILARDLNKEMRNFDYAKLFE